jgi:DNA-binding response OmpR family regulator
MNKNAVTWYVFCEHDIMPNKILIVEDDESILDVLRIILSNAGYQTSCYANGRPLMSGTFEPPDLFLLDKQLSGIDGLDICRHLKEDPKTHDIPVIMISANPQIGPLSQEAGADDYIEKPFTMEYLLRTIKRHINSNLQNSKVFYLDNPGIQRRIKD